MWRVALIGLRVLVPVVMFTGSAGLLVWWLLRDRPDVGSDAAEFGSFVACAVALCAVGSTLRALFTAATTSPVAWLAKWCAWNLAFAALVGFYEPGLMLAVGAEPLFALRAGLRFTAQVGGVILAGQAIGLLMVYLGGRGRLRWWLYGAGVAPAVVLAAKFDGAIPTLVQKIVVVMVFGSALAAWVRVARKERGACGASRVTDGGGASSPESRKPGAET